jgi:hypothetical protein
MATKNSVSRLRKLRNMGLRPRVLAAAGFGAIARSGAPPFRG